MSKKDAQSVKAPSIEAINAARDIYDSVQNLGGDYTRTESIAAIAVRIEDYHLSQVSHKWISVKERLPEKEGEYIVCYHYNYGVGKLIFSDGSWLNGSVDVSETVTYWIEKPYENTSENHLLSSPPIEGETISQTTADEEIEPLRFAAAVRELMMHKSYGRGKDSAQECANYLLEGLQERGMKVVRLASVPNLKQSDAEKVKNMTAEERKKFGHPSGDFSYLCGHDWCRCMQ